MFRRRRTQDDFEEEIRSHLELEAERLAKEGLAPTDARDEARRNFGNVGMAQQQFHESRGLRWLDDLGKDTRYAARMLRKSPGFAVVAVATLALGIGATTSVFSVVNGVLLRPLPYRDPGRIVRLWESLPGAPSIMVSYPDYLDWQTRTRVFDGIAIYSPFRSMSYSGGVLPERVGAGYASSNLFEVLGVAPQLGRFISPADDRPGAERVVVLTEAWWRRRFGADPGVIGRRLILDGETYTVVGVSRPTVGLGLVDLWIPVGLFANTESFLRGNHPGLLGIARLKPGVTIAQMNADLERVSSEIRAEHPSESAGVGAGGDFLQELLLGGIRPALRLLTWAVALVLLIACVNVANLLLGRSTGRRKEIAVRTALGASRSRIVRLLLVENVLLALGGGLIGVALAYAGVRGILALKPTGIPRLQSVNVDLTALGFAALVSLLTGLVFGVLPARQASRVDLNEALKETGRGSSAGAAPLRARSMLMVVEVAMAMMLLVGAGLLVRSFVRLSNVDPGVDPRGVALGWVNLPPAKYSDDQRQRAAMTEILRRVQALPGVTNAALSTALPLNATMQNRMTFEGHPRAKGSEPLININLISPDYFATMRMRLVSGRGIQRTDAPGAPMVVVISEVIARQFFPNENPIGKRIIHGSVESTEAPWTVVGVVSDVTENELETRPLGVVYLALDQTPMPWAVLTARSQMPAERLLPMLGKELAAFDRDLPLANESTLDELIGQSVGQERFTMFVLGTFALAALLLAVVGVYGVIAYFVTQRSHEIGIRRALGAQRTDIVSLVGRRVLVATGTGVAIGLTAAAAGSRVMTNLLFGVAVTDLSTYLTGAVALVAAAVLAAAVPTLRATRVNPARAMRAE